MRRMILRRTDPKVLGLLVLVVALMAIVGYMFAVPKTKKPEPPSTPLCPNPPPCPVPLIYGDPQPGSGNCPQYICPTTTTRMLTTTTPPQPVQLYFKPAFARVSVGQVFPVAIEAATGTQRVDTIAVYSSFNNTYLEIVNATNTSVFPVSRMRRYSNTAGLLEHQVSKITGELPYGNLELVTVYFRAKSAGSTHLTFLTSAPRETEIVFNRTALPQKLGNATIMINP